VSASSPGPRPELAGLTIADAPELWAALGFTVAAGRLVLGGIDVCLGGEGRGITGWTLRHVSAVSAIDGLPTAVTADPPPPAVPTGHPNGALGIDQVVVTTPDFDRTAAALDAAGMPLRRIKPADASAARSGEAGRPAGGELTGGSYRQGFRRLGPAILELVEATPSSPGVREANSVGSCPEGNSPAPRGPQAAPSPSARAPRGPQAAPSPSAHTAGPARFWGLVVVVPDLPALRRRLSPHVSEIRDAVQPGRHIAALSAAAGLSPRVAFMDPE